MMSVNFHDTSKAVASEAPLSTGRGYVTFEDGAGNFVNVFMKQEHAVAIAALYDALNPKPVEATSPVVAAI